MNKHLAARAALSQYSQKNEKLQDPAGDILVTGVNNEETPQTNQQDEERRKQEEQRIQKEDAKRQAQMEQERERQLKLEAQDRERQRQLDAMRYLPIRTQGAVCLKKLDANVFLADNSKLKSKGPGVAYRKSKDLQDKDGTVIPWNSWVIGKDEGDGWVKCRVMEKSKYAAMN